MNTGVMDVLIGALKDTYEFRTHDESDYFSDAGNVVKWLKDNGWKVVPATQPQARVEWTPTALHVIIESPE